MPGCVWFLQVPNSPPCSEMLNLNCPPAPPRVKLTIALLAFISPTPWASVTLNDIRIADEPPANGSTKNDDALFSFITGAWFAVTVTILSFVLKLPLVSLALAVKLMTQPAAQLIVIFWLNCALVPDKLKLKYLTNPVSLTITCPVLNPTASVAFAVRLITSFCCMLVKDLLKLAFTTGAVLSATTTKVLFCFTLLFVSVAYKVKLTTQVSVQVNVVELLTVALLPDSV